MRNTIRFMLAGQVEEIADCRPTDTVLDYLRERRKRVGTKEGCAEGDCGACTVVLAEPVEGRLRYRAFNSCILFMPALDGKLLITVEDLQQDGSLHPVQQAMVEQHGSQCGFCTPGFVMSLFALSHDEAAGGPSREAIDTALAGNLCRCTGYAPIVRAAGQVLASEHEDRFTVMESAISAQLESLRSTESLAMAVGGTRYFAPSTLHELLTTLEAHPDAILLAGGTDVGLWVTKQLKDLQTIIHTTGVRELNEVRCDEESGVLSIGAAVTYTDVLPVLTGYYPEFTELLSRLGAVQVRNAGTVGGNIANGSPIGDMPPGLIALGARLVLAGPTGERIIDLEDFFLSYGKQDLRPGECVVRILLPTPLEGQEFRVYKLSRRIEQDISSVCAAFRVMLGNGLVKNARVCFGGMAGTPSRARNCEAALKGHEWNAKTVEAAMAALESDYEPLSDVRASAGYRMAAAQNLLRRFYLEIAEPEVPVRIERPRATEQASA